MKITEIKVSAGKDAVVFQPKSVLAVFKGRSWTLDDKLAAQLWKAIAGQAEKLCTAIENRKP
jgi:hypothetical protein